MFKNNESAPSWIIKTAIVFCSFELLIACSESDDGPSKTAVVDDGKDQAVYYCAQAAKDSAIHRDTAKFSYFDVTSKKIGDRRFVITSSMTAKNSFGLELKHRVRCEVNNGDVEIIDVTTW